MFIPSPALPARLRRDGFAIVVTVAILLLLAVVAVGLLSLSSISVRSAGKGAAEQEARANARLGLLIALGELQLSLGPDRRVSASAEILDASPESESIEGVANPHWTAVWSTEWAGGGTPWQRDDEEGGLRDLRGDGTWDAGEAVVHYLVSGNEGGRERAAAFLDARSANLSSPDAITLVGEGSTETPDGEVLAPRVPVQTVEHGAPRETGSYAYWVGDLGVKANLGRPDAHRDQALDGSAAGLERLVHAQDTEEELVADLGTIGEDEADRLFSTPTLGLLPLVKAEELRRHFHDITTYSRSVLANVRDGGLQGDLTAYLQSSGNVPPLRDGGRITTPGLSDADRMTGPANVQAARNLGLSTNDLRYWDVAPRFSLLRRWAELGSETGFSQSSTDMVPPAPLRDRNLLTAMNDGVNVYDNANKTPASFLPYDRPNLAPVLVEGSLFYNLATYPEGSGTSAQWVLRLCLYPRVSLWNPYSIELKLPRTVAQMFVNGNKQVHLRRIDGSERDVDLPFGRGSVAGNRHPAHYRGTVLWTLPEVTIAPGETLVFSPAGTGRYELDNIAANRLAPTAVPDPTRYFYQDMERRHSRAPATFYEWPKSGNGSGADNNLMALKNAGSPTLNDVAFDSLPTIVYANTSLQAGGSDEYPVRWDSTSPVPVHRLSSAGARISPGAIPDVRTRDGFRLRWWHEHLSNQLGSGLLSGHPRHLQSALLANWNPRASYFCRTPWENVTNQPPHFYGAYTRDLFDTSVSWDALAPRSRGGRMLGFPFGPPQEGPDTLVLFEVPRAEVGIPSLGYLRHLKASEFGWHPSYAIGNSLADPRVGRAGTSPVPLNARERSQGGWNQYTFGWANDRGAPDYWALLTRQILFEKPTDNNMVYDLSYELNYTLWDNYYLSTGTVGDKAQFLESPEEHPLPNGRMGLFSDEGSTAADLDDFHRAARRLALEGGFNVHSVRKEAWKALLASTRDTGFASTDRTPFPRLLDPPGGEAKDGSASDSAIYDGFRSLSDEDIDRLAAELVVEIKRRAPFFGLADFVNRRLRDDDTGAKGPLQSAIDAVGINAELDRAYPLDNSTDLPRVTFDNISDATRLDQTLKPHSTAWGIPGYLTQGDVLQVAGSTLRARSDSFVIRAYGDSVDSGGKVLARAWCEAVVQRVPEPLFPDGTGINPVDPGGKTEFGRRFRLVSFRWLGSREV